METSKFPSSLLSYKISKDETVFLTLMKHSHLPDVRVLGLKAWGKYFHLRMINLEEQMTFFDSGCWVVHNSKGELVAYMISNPFEVRDIPLDTEYSDKLTEEQLLEKIYLIHDIVVEESYRNAGIRKHLHKLAVEEAKLRKITKIYGVALTWSFRKPEKKYRFQLLCKARFHNEDSFVVVRDLSLE